MNILIGFLYVVEVLVCLMLALVVMLQKPKEGGLGGAFGGGALEATATLGAIFLLNTLVLAKLTSTKKSGSVLAGVNAAPVEQAPLPMDLPAAAPEAPAVPAPAAPAAPAPAAPAASEAPAAPAPAAPAAPAAQPEAN